VFPPPRRHATEIPAAEAKSLGERIRASTGADHDTGNPVQPYRVAGTINFPNKGKQARGRVTTPTRVVSVTARLWTPTELIEAFPLPEPKTNGGGRHHGETGSHGSFDENDIPAELMVLIRDGVEEPHRSEQFFGAVAALKRLGWTIDGITVLLEKFPNGIGAKFAGRIRAEVERAFGKVPNLDTRPIIRVRAGGLDATATRAEEVLRAAGAQLFQRSGKLVRPVVDEAEAAHGRRTKVARFVPVDATYLRDRLCRVARWERFDMRAKQWVATDPPSAVPATVLARVGEWGFGVVAGIITTPTMRPDGSLLTAPGYDPATRLLLIEPPTMLPIPEAPTREDALAALARLEGLLAEFPLVEDVARAVALSSLITPVVRGAFTVAPMHALVAPVAGSGKSYLLDLVSAIATGQRMPVMAAGRDEEETEKRLGAALMTGQPLISIDNVSGALMGDALCQMIERPVVEVRILGKSELVRIEARSTTFFCNGNNMVLFGDLCRRTLVCTLDPRLERPELREFTGNPLDDVLANRGIYVAAALTVCRAYAAAGRPDKAKRLASFEDWSDTVRSALMWLGRADPVASMEVAREEDPELRELRDMLSAWANKMGVGHKYACKLQDIIDRCSENNDNGPAHPELHSAVQAAAGRRGQADARGLGDWVRRRKRRIVDNLYLTCKQNAKGGSLWWVERQDGKDVPPQPSVVTSPAAGPVLVRGMRETGLETELGVQMVTVGGREVWLPRSQIEIVEVGNGLLDVTMPGWIAKKEKLEFTQPEPPELPF
jgi:hypothetical protein